MDACLEQMRGVSTDVLLWPCLGGICLFCGGCYGAEAEMLSGCSGWTDGGWCGIIGSCAS
eukprot:scaffold39652_cov211-Skeletonema_dohrnii-CCMP3373.AAC.2